MTSPAHPAARSRAHEPALPCRAGTGRGFFPERSQCSLPPVWGRVSMWPGPLRGAYPKGDGVTFLLIAFLLLPAVAFCAYMADREIRLLDDEIRGER